jgi:V8-like Glu-specific endopeptidase
MLNQRLLPFWGLLILSSTAHAKEDAVFGPDDRTPVTDASFPWQAIGKITLSNGNYCTGTLIGRCQVLTAAHCLVDESTHKLTPLKVTFTASAGGPSATGIGFWLGTTKTNTELNGDWAVMKIDKPLGLTLGTFKISSIEGPDDTVRPHLVMAGYSSDLFDGTELTKDEDVTIYRTTQDNLIKTDADGSFGASGSAIWSWAPDRKFPEIVGIYTRAFDSKFDHYTDANGSTGVASAQFKATASAAIAEGCN